MCYTKKFQQEAEKHKELYFDLNTRIDDLIEFLMTKTTKNRLDFKKVHQSYALKVLNHSQHAIKNYPIYECDVSSSGSAPRIFCHYLDSQQKQVKLLALIKKHPK